GAIAASLDCTLDFDHFSPLGAGGSGPSPGSDAATPGSPDAAVDAAPTGDENPASDGGSAASDDAGDGPAAPPSDPAGGAPARDRSGGASPGEASGAAALPCNDPGNVVSGGHCYSPTPNRGSWSPSSAASQAAPAHLVPIGSNGEQTAVS